VTSILEAFYDGLRRPPADPPDVLVLSGGWQGHQVLPKHIYHVMLHSTIQRAVRGLLDLDQSMRAHGAAQGRAASIEDSDA
jgi:hypothetical protein